MGIQTTVDNLLTVMAKTKVTAAEIKREIPCNP